MSVVCSTKSIPILIEHQFSNKGVGHAISSNIVQSNLKVWTPSQEEFGQTTSQFDFLWFIAQRNQDAFWGASCHDPAHGREGVCVTHDLKTHVGKSRDLKADLKIVY